MQIKKSIHLLNLILSDKKDRKYFTDLILDLLKWVYRDKGGLYFFYIYHLYRKGRNVSDFMTIGDYLKIHNQLDPKYYRPMLEDKIVFDRYVKSFNIPSPEMLGIISKSTIFWIREKTYDSLESILKQDFHAYCKQVIAYGGHGVFKIDVKDGALWLNNEVSTIENLEKILGSGKYILQRTIEQHEELNRLNPSCVNTIRVYTVNDGRETFFYGAVIRIGVNDSIVDNVTSENLATGITEDHFLHTVASTGTNPPLYVTRHPNTHVVFSEFKVPYLKEAYDLCAETHRYFDEFFFIAWDVAITPEGPMMLEGNPAADLIWMQLLYGGQRQRFNEFARKFRESQSS